jgi:error-prone DNA polymerase
VPIAPERLTRGRGQAGAGADQAHDASIERPPQRLGVLLCTHSTFTFGAGTASPTTLVRRAAELGYAALALTDTLNVTGGAELFQAADRHGIQALIGATLPVRIDAEVFPLVAIAASRSGYGTLNELITHAHAREERDVPWPVLLSHTHDLIVLTGGRDGLPAKLLAQRRVRDLEERMRELAGAFPERTFVQLFHDRLPWDARRARVLRRFAQSLALPTVAAPEVKYALEEDYALYDALMCARLGIGVQQPHPDRPRNRAGAIPHAEEAARRLPFPEALLNALHVAERASFDLLPERLVVPQASVPKGLTADQHLERRCFEALLVRYDAATLPIARRKLEEELATVRALALAEFFLVAAEVTDYCRAHGILAAGRGSAAASICCYLLGITGVDPVKYDLLFERFLHTGKSAMPDVDIDISSARRDEVIAWVESRFGQATEAMVCNKITYRLPLAIQDLGRALGLPPEQRTKLSRALGRDFRHMSARRAREAGPAFDEVLGDAPAKEALLRLLERLEPVHPRHLAPHSGGVVLSREPLTHYAPLERSSGGIKIVQLDKDDAEALGLIKLDLLGLRMLAALERAREEVFRLEGVWIDLADLPDDERVWDLISQGATLGLFQVESPSQIHTSRVMRSRTMRDLAHQIALIRPGPIQSGTVHPYLRRRQGLEPTTFWHPSLEAVLGKTYGVLLFQEDVLRIAVHFAGMTWTEADRFRKKVSSWRTVEDIEPDRQAFIAGALRHVGATPEQAETVFEAVKGFQGFGFAESHAWAFAIHAYASGWLRVHYPAEYLAAIMTEEPGMWSPSTKRHEARLWDVPFLPIDVNRSGVHYRVAWARRDGKPVKAVRPPLCAIKGVSEATAREIMLDRLRAGAFASVDDLHARVPLARDVTEALARGGALDALGDRREALFRIGVLAGSAPAGTAPLLASPVPTPGLEPLPIEGRLVWDMHTARFSTLELHPIDLVRDQLRELGAMSLHQVARRGRGATVRTAGLVVSRQKPPTAKGFAFYVLEDGPIRAQLIISPDLWTAHRTLVRDAMIIVADAEVVDTGYQLTLKATTLGMVEGVVGVRGYEFG